MQLATQISRSDKQKQPSSRCSLFFQPKLTINQPNDVYEQEADAVAEHVMRMPETKSESSFFQSKPLPVTTIQRQCATCEKEELQRKEEEDEESPVQLKSIKSFDIWRKCAECEQEEKLQMRTQNFSISGTTAPSIVHDVINSGGQSLDSGTRNFMESRFGYDFANVQVHTDSLAHRSSKEINALAYTHGNHIAFAPGQYQPNTYSGKQLLAHELTHVVQQGAGKQRTIQRHVLENDPATAPVMSCQVANSTPIGLSLDIIFAVNSSALTPPDIAAIDNFVNNWHLSGGTEPVRVDGYASIEGGPATNWPLSCSRAEILFNELTTPTSGTPGIPPAFIDVFANGETEQFSRSSLGPNRRASATIPLPIPPPPPATSAVFSESPTQVFQGYDNSVAPNFQVVPVGETRVAAVTVVPVGALPTFVSLNPAIATVHAIGLGVEITGIADGNTRIEARQGATVLDTLRIEVKAQRSVTVDYHFMSDTASPGFLGIIPPQPQHRTTRVVGSAPGLTATLNRIWQRQANVLFTTGTVNSPIIPSNLGPQVVAANAGASEWVTVTGFRTGGTWNVFLVWEFETVASAGVDGANAGTANSDTLLEDNDCIDGLTLSHEAGHFLSGAALPHTAAGIMGACGAPNYDRVRKNEADAANP